MSANLVPKIGDEKRWILIKGCLLATSATATVHGEADASRHGWFGNQVCCAGLESSALSACTNKQIAQGYAGEIHDSEVKFTVQGEIRGPG